VSKPEIALDPSLSIYRLVRRTRDDRTLLNHRRTMEIVSYDIENAIIRHRIPARVFSAFQEMSRFLPQINRYRTLAQFTESIYVFGVMDVEPPPIPKVHYIAVRPTDQLAKEWFLVADSQEYFSALATEEITPNGLRGTDRLFEGIWSFDSDLVNILQEWLSSMVGARPLNLTRQNRNYRQQVSVLTETLGHMAARLSQSMERGTANARRTGHELQTLVDDRLKPSLDDASKQTPIP